MVEEEEEVVERVKEGHSGIGLSYRDECATGNEVIPVSPASVSWVQGEQTKLEKMDQLHRERVSHYSVTTA